MRHVVVLLAAIPLTLVMAVMLVPATVFEFCDALLAYLVTWRDRDDA